jgi:two-component system, LytTR family, response regulator
MQDQVQVLRLFISTIEGYYPVNTDELIYCTANKSYTVFHLIDNRQYLVTRSLKEYEELLVPYNFFRIHKSFLVNIHHIQKVIKTDGMSVLMSNDEELPVSFRKKNQFINIIKNFHIYNR